MGENQHRFGSNLPLIEAFAVSFAFCVSAIIIFVYGPLGLNGNKIVTGLLYGGPITFLVLSGLRNVRRLKLTLLDFVYFVFLFCVALSIIQNHAAADSKALAFALIAFAMAYPAGRLLSVESIHAVPTVLFWLAATMAFAGAVATGWEFISSDNLWRPMVFGFVHGPTVFCFCLGLFIISFLVKYDRIDGNTAFYLAALGVCAAIFSASLVRFSFLAIILVVVFICLMRRDRLGFACLAVVIGAVVAGQLSRPTQAAVMAVYVDRFISSSAKSIENYFAAKKPTESTVATNQGNGLQSPTLPHSGETPRADLEAAKQHLESSSSTDEISKQTEKRSETSVPTEDRGTVERTNRADDEHKAPISTVPQPIEIERNRDSPPTPTQSTSQTPSSIVQPSQAVPAKSESEPTAIGRINVQPNLSVVSKDTSDEKKTMPSCSGLIDLNDSISIRRALVLDAFQLIPTAGFFGIGLSAFGTKGCLPEFEAHNFVLQALVELGWVAGFLYVLAVILPFVLLSRKARTDLNLTFYLSALLFTFAIGMAHGKVEATIPTFIVLGILSRRLAEKSSR